MVRRRWLPVVLVYLGLFALIGCIYVPSFERPRTPHGTDPRKLIGGPGSRRAISTGAADRDLVERLLGKPTVVSSDGRAMGYDYFWSEGKWYGLCAGSDWEPFAIFHDGDRERYLFLRFSAEGTMTEFAWMNPTTPMTALAARAGGMGLVRDPVWRAFAAGK